MAKIGLQDTKTATQWAVAAQAAGGVRAAFEANLGADSLAPDADRAFTDAVRAAEAAFHYGKDPFVVLQELVDELSPPEE